MSSDNIQRQIEFIIEHQAKFSESITKLEKQSRENAQNIAELEKQSRESTQNIAKLADVILSLGRIVGEQGQQISALIEQGKQTDRRLMETDDRLKSLIDVVERHISGHNGMRK